MTTNPKADLLLRRIVVSLDFFEALEDLGDIARELREGARSAYARGDVRSLRLLANDIDSLAGGLSQVQRERFQQVLALEAGVNREDERSKLKTNVAVALRRGRVASEKERRRLEDYLALLESEGGNEDERAAIRQLLVTG